MTTIELTVSPTGETTIETKGFAGDGCRETSRFLQQALGVKQSDRPTAEAFASADEAALHQSS